MRGEVNYLCGQLEQADSRSKALTSFIEKTDVNLGELDIEAIDDYLDSVANEGLLQGYSVEEDGTFVIASNISVPDEGYNVALKDELVIISDDERFKNYEPVGDFVNSEVIDAIERSVADDIMVRVVDDEVNAAMLDAEQVQNRLISSHIDYLYAKKLDNYTVFMMLSANQVFKDRSSIMAWTTLSFFVLLLVVFALIFQLLNRIVAKRIDQENEVLARVEAGDLDARSEVGGTHEFSSLSKGINDTVDTLKGWIAEAEARMDAELATAKAIQEATLPRTFPPYPDIPKFDIYASMNAARQVGGDFYDYFLIGEDCGPDEGKLGFVIADVSGKGVPAALFMMKAKALLRDYVSSGMDVGEAVAEANRQLCDGNDESMFVTAWVGVLDYQTGHVDYVNAGHNPPLLRQRDGGWQWLRQKSGPVLGLFEVPYKAHSVECATNDTFLLYTDGVTEAFSATEELYGEERLMATVQANDGKHPHDLQKAVREDVAAWASGAEQSDDITILALEVGVPPQSAEALVLPARLDQLDTVNEFLHDELDQRLCPKRTQNQLDIAVEELFVNVCRYAYPDATEQEPGSVRIQRAYSADPPCITVKIVDEGIPFDPLAKPDAVTPDNIVDVPIGGLGILMAKKSVDEMHYERVDGSNVLTIVKKW